MELLLDSTRPQAFADSCHQRTRGKDEERLPPAPVESHALPSLIPSPTRSRRPARQSPCYHHSSIAEKLRQPVLAASLEQGIPMPEQLRGVTFVWEVVQGPLSGTRFVGGYFPGADGEPKIREENGRLYFLPHNPFRLDSPSATFFGVEESIFRRVVSVARGGGLNSLNSSHLPARHFSIADSAYSVTVVPWDRSSFSHPLGNSLSNCRHSRWNGRIHAGNQVGRQSQYHLV